MKKLFIVLLVLLFTTMLICTSTERVSVKSETGDQDGLFVVQTQNQIDVVTNNSEKAIISTWVEADLFENVINDNSTLSVASCYQNDIDTEVQDNLTGIYFEEQTQRGSVLKAKFDNSLNNLNSHDDYEMRKLSLSAGALKILNYNTNDFANVDYLIQNYKVSSVTIETFNDVNTGDVNTRFLFL